MIYPASAQPPFRDLPCIRPTPIPSSTLVLMKSCICPNPFLSSNLFFMRPSHTTPCNPQPPFRYPPSCSWNHDTPRPASPIPPFSPRSYAVLICRSHADLSPDPCSSLTILQSPLWPSPYIFYPFPHFSNSLLPPMTSLASLMTL